MDNKEVCGAQANESLISAETDGDRGFYFCKVKMRIYECRIDKNTLTELLGRMVFQIIVANGKWGPFEQRFGVKDHSHLQICER